MYVGVHINAMHVALYVGVAIHLTADSDSGVIKGSKSCYFLT